MPAYLRNFAVASFIVVVFIAIGAGVLFKHISMNNMISMIEHGTQGVVDGYKDAVWYDYRDELLPLTATPALLREYPKINQFAKDTIDYFHQSPLVRVNIYNSAGVLLLSDAIRKDIEIGGDGFSPDNAFVLANLKAKEPESQRLKNVAMLAGDDILLLQTIVVIRSNKIELVVEVLNDASEIALRTWKMQWLAMGCVVLLFFVFLGMLSMATGKSEEIIAKQHETNLQLAEAAATAEAQNREKSQFLANISHELRTPLNAIIGFSDIIRNELLPSVTEKKYHDFINDINSSGVHLLSLINDILDYSKAEAGKLELEVSEVNVTKMIANSMRLVSPRAEAGNVRLVEQLPKEPITMISDSKKFKQILLNLLSNAVKFTPAGGEVRVMAWVNVADDTITFEVQDTGIGIAPKDISRAMSPFGQVDNTLKRKYEGTGLGLPLTKKFVELMGGKFNIESEVNKGTTITFTLPREVTEREGIVIKQVS